MAGAGANRYLFSLVSFSFFLFIASIFFYLYFILKYFVVLLADNHSDLVKQYLIGTFAVRFEQMTMHPD